VKNIAILDESGALISRVDTGEKSRPEAVLVSPLDLHTYIVPIPPLRSEQISGAVRYRLRALHPGNPDTARVDHQANGNSANSVIAFVTETSIEERYRKTGLRAIAPISIMRRMAPKDTQKWIGLFFTNHWIEATFFEGKELISIEAIAAGFLEDEKIESLINAVAGDHPLAATPVKMLVIPGHSPNIDLIEEKLRALGATSIQTLSTCDLPSRSTFEDESLFLTVPRHKIKTGQILAILLCIDIILAVASIHRIADLREQELEAIKTEYSSAKAQLMKQEMAIRELEELENRYAAYTKSRPVDIYAAVAEISRCIGDGAWIKDLVIRGNAFSIEAEGTDALAVLTRFTDSPRFNAVTLHQAEPSAERGESFSISGIIRDDR
jgi:hypothetical protein